MEKKFHRMRTNDLRRSQRRGRPRCLISVNNKANSSGVTSLGHLVQCLPIQWRMHSTTVMLHLGRQGRTADSQ